ncbi:MAG: PAS domain S-box protein [Nitrospinota bacterium]|nr:PAS domain S-box protein [Nitrospinota bacterium]
MAVFSIRTKLFLGFGALLLMMAAAGAYELSHNAWMVRQTTHVYDNSIATARAALVAKSGVIFMQHSMEDLANYTKEEERSLAWENETDQEAEVLRQLDLVAQSVEDEQGRILVEKISGLMLAWRPIRQEASSLAEQGRLDAALKLTREKGAAHAASIMQAMDQLWKSADEKGKTQIRRIHKSVAKDGVRMALAFGVALAAALAISLFLSHHIGGRLEMIHQASEKIAMGKFGHVIDVAGADEIAQLADTFNLMSVSLEGLHETLNKQIASSIADKEERLLLEKAIEQAGEAVVITGTDGSIQYVNPAFETTTGYSRSEVIGKNPRILKSGAHDSGFYKGIWDTLTSGGVWMGVITNRKKDGSVYYDQATLSPVKNENGQITNYVAVKRNITEWKKVENELAQLREKEKELHREKLELEKALLAQKSLTGWDQSAVTANLAGVGPLRERDSKGFTNLKKEYEILLDEYLEALGFKRPPDRQKIGALAEKIGVIGGGPRDVIDLHIRAVADKSQDVHPKRARAYTVEGRLLALEIMGNLVDYYRSVIPRHIRRKELS